MRLVLASESPRRRELLGRLGCDFEVAASDAQELQLHECSSPEELVTRNAYLKAEAVSLKYPDAWVLGADTVVVMAGQVYGKPGDLAEAASFLRTFSGREHEVLTGVVLLRKTPAQSESFVARSQVRFHKLDDKLISEYLALVPVLDKAGAYGIQDHGDMLVESIDGELENIIGLPVAALAGAFRKLGIK